VIFTEKCRLRGQAHFLGDPAGISAIYAEKPENPA
jgi:hypothetical protein